MARVPETTSDDTRWSHEVNWLRALPRSGVSCRLYRIWGHMKHRCNCHSGHAYANYGGRGISVCAEWHNDYAVFRVWAIHSGYRKELTLDRVNVNGNYEPANCRWATRAEQQRNRRDTLWLGNEPAVLVALANGVSRETFCSRTRQGWDVCRAAKTTPKKYDSSRRKRA